LFPAGDAAALAACLARLADDTALLTDLSRNCRMPKTIAAYVDELLALYAHGPLRDARGHDYHDGSEAPPRTASAS
jgi:hypothetical protein